MRAVARPESNGRWGWAREAVRRLLEWVTATFEPLIERLIRVGLVQSAIVLAAQTFLALFPLLIAVIAIVPTSIGTTIADALRDRLGISGNTDTSVHQLVDTRSELHGVAAVGGVILVLASATSFTRALQRTYETAWGLPTLGLRGRIQGLMWLVGIVAYLALTAGALRLTAGAGPAANELRWVINVLSAGMVWWWTPFLLLAGRVRARALLPGAGLSAAVVIALGAVSEVYLPRAMRQQERRYGTIGTVFAIESWLVVLAGAIVACAVVGAVGAQYPGRLGQRIRGSHDPDGWRRHPVRRRDRRPVPPADRPTPDPPVH
jgi:membrane protein